MMYAMFLGLLSLSLHLPISIASDLPLKLEVKSALDSDLANVHLSEVSPSVYPYTVTYGSCNSLEPHHTISTVNDPGTDRLLWTLPKDILPNGCLFAHSPQQRLIGRSEPLTINKRSPQWVRKRERDTLFKRSGIPMTNASGIDAQGPWFNGVELLKEKEISAVNVKEAKAQSESICRVTILRC